MYSLSPFEIHEYLNQAGEQALGSVGCYQIEHLAMKLFSDLSGSHSTIMGIPMEPLTDFLANWLKKDNSA